MGETITLHHGTDRDTASRLASGEIQLIGHLIPGDGGFAANLTPQLGESVYWAWISTWGDEPMSKERINIDSGMIVTVEAPVGEVECVGKIAWSHGQSEGYIPIGHRIQASEVPPTYLEKVGYTQGMEFFVVPSGWIKQIEPAKPIIPSWY